MNATAKGYLDLVEIARKNLGSIRRNLSTPRLVEEIVRNREGHLAHLGAVVVRSAHHADCEPADRYLVGEGADDGLPRLSQEQFDGLFRRLLSYAQNRDFYVQDCYAGAEERHRIALRVVTETAWHSLFARNLFHQIHGEASLEAFAPDWTVAHLPGFLAVPERDGTRGSAFVAAHPEARLIIIGGSGYGGDLRQALTSIVGSLHPDPGVLPLRGAANVGPRGDASLFLGRTGNGKTALAADPQRRLVGDHLLGWTDEGLFTYLWGSYAKVCKLNAGDEPLIHACTRKFGTILENTGLEQRSRRVRLDDDSLTSNIRACYPISHLAEAERSGTCGHPKHVFLLTRDSTGVLPPIARLDTEQAVFAFITSYVSSLMETEARPGDVTPVIAEGPAHRPVLGAVDPTAYAGAFMKHIIEQRAHCWFVNTGWVGEPMGASERIPLAITRTLVRAAQNGELDAVAYEEDPLFGFQIPTRCTGVDSRWLSPRERAADDGEYELRANQLAASFIAGFARFADHMPESVRQMVSKVVLYEDTLDVMERFKLSF